MNRRRFIALLAALPLVRYFRRPPGRKYEWVMGPIITQPGNRDHNVESVNGKLEFVASGPMQRVAYGQLLTVDDRPGPALGVLQKRDGRLGPRPCSLPLLARALSNEPSMGRSPQGL